MKRSSVLCLKHRKKSCESRKIFTHVFLSSAMPNTSPPAIFNTIRHNVYTTEFPFVGKTKSDVIGLCWKVSCSFVLWILRNNKDCYQQLHSFLCTWYCFLRFVVLPGKKKKTWNFPYLHVLGWHFYKISANIIKSFYI